MVAMSTVTVRARGTRYQALQQYGSGFRYGSVVMEAWAAAKLFERTGLPRVCLTPAV